MVVQNVENGLLKVLIDVSIYVLVIRNLSKEQQSELKCKIQRTIVYDYLKAISE